MSDLGVGGKTQQLIAEQELVRDARFLMDSGYQAPRSLRLGLKLGSEGPRYTVAA